MKFHEGDSTVNNENSGEDRKKAHRVPRYVYILIIPCIAVIALLVVTIVSMYQRDTQRTVEPQQSVISLTVSEPSLTTFPASESYEPPKTFVKDGAVMYLAAGSSTCPPNIASATYDTRTGTVLLISSRTNSRQACTMDLRPFSQRITLPSGEKIPDNVTISVLKMTAGMEPVRR